MHGRQRPTVGDPSEGLAGWSDAGQEQNTLIIANMMVFVGILRFSSLYSYMGLMLVFYAANGLVADARQRNAGTSPARAIPIGRQPLVWPIHTPLIA
jgi:hypothetical protein